MSDHYKRLLENCNVENEVTDEVKETIEEISSQPEVLDFIKRMLLKYA